MLSTAKALYENETPSISIEITKLDEYNLGMLIMFFQISVAITGEMLEVNTFNQPGVELSKNYTYEMMGRKK
jgi:glucose-6-phosphate isomerase